MRFPCKEPAQGGLDRQTIALINIVFLILIFLMIAGSLRTVADATIAPPLATIDRPASVTEDRIINIFADGRVSYRGREVPVDDIGGVIAEEAAAGASSTLWVVADRAANANQMIGVVESVRRSHRGDVHLVTVRDGDR